MGGRGAGSHSSKSGAGKRGTITERQHDYLSHLVKKVSPHDPRLTTDRKTWTGLRAQDFSIKAKAYEMASKTHPIPKSGTVSREERRAARRAHDEARRKATDKLLEGEWRAHKKRVAQVNGLAKNPKGISRLSKEGASSLIDYLK